jgi:uncharacterized coiled-coil protein SlyX
MSVLKRLQYYSLTTINEYVDSYQSMNDVSSERHLDIIKLRAFIQEAREASSLRSELQQYSEKLLSSHWWWVPLYSGSRLGNRLKTVLNMTEFSEKEILIAERNEFQSSNSSIATEINSQWENRLSKLENTVQSVSSQLVENENEIKKLRSENQFLLAKLQEIQAQKVRQEEEIATLRRHLITLLHDKKSTASEMEQLRIENQRLRELLDRANAPMAVSPICVY